MTSRLTSLVFVVAAVAAAPAVAESADNASAPGWGDGAAWYQQQAQAQPGGTAASAGAVPPPAPWDASCTGTTRTHAQDCQLEQRVVISNTGQLLVDMTVRLPDPTTDPVMMIHTPFGLFLPAGLRLAVDGKEFASLPLQTCDGGGCYAGSPMAGDLLNAMQQGTSLTVTFQNLQKKDIAIPVSLLGFGKAYAQIK